LNGFALIIAPSNELKFSMEYLSQALFEFKMNAEGLSQPQ
jgi:hypothetical protein